MSIELGTIDCSCVLESDPTVRKYIDMVKMVTTMINKYVKKARADLRRLVMKYSVTLNMTAVASLFGSSQMYEAMLSVKGR
jgi:hypothetical protein